MQKTYLSIDVGKKLTQAWLFAEKEGTWCLQSHSSVPTVVDGEVDDFRRCVTQALRQIEVGAEVRLLSNNGQISDIRHLSGAPAAVGLSLSAGKPIRTALIGLSEAYSLASLRRLVGLFNCEVVLEVNLQENLNATEQLERLAASDIELFIISGGTNGGAQKELKAVIENLRLVYHLFPHTTRPQVVFCGNQDLADYAKDEIEAGLDMHLASNIQTALGQDDPSIVWRAMLAAFERLRIQQIAGLAEVASHLHARLVPSDFAAGRMVRFLESSGEPGKGVLMLRFDGDTISVIAGRQQRLNGINSRPIVTDTLLREARSFSRQVIDLNSFATYIYNHTLFSHYIPATIEDLCIEQAYTTARIRQALTSLQRIDPEFGYNADLGLLNEYDPIILSGSEASLGSPHQGLMIALNSILPHGITTVLQDKVQLLTALGSIAPYEPLLPIQVMDQDGFVNLATVVTVDSPGGLDQNVLQIEVDEGAGMARLVHRIVMGELKRIETSARSQTNLYLAPDDESDVGMGLPGLGGWVSATESKVGVVIDARGRPIWLPTDEIARAESLHNWLWEVGG